ncbi:hypothetical protein LMG26857_03470 [Achromobacter anxifer]|uniref:DUF2623 family protein n=1 Tax=Achromobacter anxifer TaxID=1287737 RepID=UPI00155C3F3E|nr:DUF2623 family protein [Achromobacter anxifer]CAB5514411.1 hypothetical protein LMG26857_03470 [Achromobacter anxifer]
MTNKALFDAGYKVGLITKVAPEDPYEMSTFHDDYKIGFILGHSYSQGVQAASGIMDAMTAGELAFRYHVPVRQVLDMAGYDGEQVRIFEDAYRQAHENYLEAEGNED